MMNLTDFNGLSPIPIGDMTITVEVSLHRLNADGTGAIEREDAFEVNFTPDIATMYKQGSSLIARTIRISHGMLLQASNTANEIKAFASISVPTGTVASMNGINGNLNDVLKSGIYSYEEKQKALNDLLVSLLRIFGEQAGNI